MKTVLPGCNDRLRRFARKGARRLSLAKSLALNLDEHWSLAKTSEPGPVDVIDLFSGCGGMSAGFLAVNSLVPAYRLAMAIDIDGDSNLTYEKNLGLRPTKLNVAQLAAHSRSTRSLINKSRSSATAPLVMIGCAPCQGFSSHRNSAGRTDVRNSLFVSFSMIAAAVKPDAIIVENVPEILTDDYWPLVAQAREVLAQAGYKSQLVVHNMAEFGVPQNRYRALLIAMRRDFRMPKGFLARDDFRTVRAAIADLPRVKPGVAPISDPMHFTANHRPSTIDTIRAVPRDGGSRPWAAGPDCLRRAASRQGRAAYEDVYGRLWWDRPAITITAYARNPASGRYVHPEQNRGLSVREAALLQGFPKNYTFEGSFDSRFRQIGNAVPPSFSAFLGAHVVGELFGQATPDKQMGCDIRAAIGPSFSRLIPALKAGYRSLDDQGVRM
jgi:DNA (cytosine-5)-methyltransferase 1